MITSNLVLRQRRSFPPATLLNLDPQQRLPLTQDNFVPIRIFNLGLFGLRTQLFQPELNDLGAGAIGLSFGEPFGFVKADAGRLVRSQQTKQLQLRPGQDSPNQWVATLDTERRLSMEDEVLIMSGVNLYAMYATTKIEEQGLV